MSVTIRDVAKAAGVSVATVSRVLNNTGPASDEARRKILKAAEVLRYVPHGGARSLITSHTSTVGVLLPDMHGEFFSEVIRGVDRTAREAGYHLLVSSSHSEKSGVEATLRATRGRVDGLIVMTPEADEALLQATLPDSLPIVLLNCASEGMPYDSIGTDNYGGATAMVRHLLDTGHRRIAFIGGPERNEDARERRRGYREALLAAGVPWEPELEIPGDFSEAAGFEAGARILKLDPRPTAVFAANDSMAIGVISAFREAGIVVPEDIALAGFDDIPISRYVAPPLTSVHVAIEQMGARAMQMLLEAMAEKNRHARRRETLLTTLIVRESCGGRRVGQPAVGGSPVRRDESCGRAGRQSSGSQGGQGTRTGKA